MARENGAWRGPIRSIKIDTSESGPPFGIVIYDTSRFPNDFCVSEEAFWSHLEARDRLGGIVLVRRSIWQFQTRPFWRLLRV